MQVAGVGVHRDHADDPFGYLLLIFCEEVRLRVIVTSGQNGDRDRGANIEHLDGPDDLWNGAIVAFGLPSRRRRDVCGGGVLDVCRCGVVAFGRLVDHAGGEVDGAVLFGRGARRDGAADVTATYFVMRRSRRTCGRLNGEQREHCHHSETHEHEPVHDVTLFGVMNSDVVRLINIFLDLPTQSNIFWPE